MQLGLFRSTIFLGQSFSPSKKDTNHPVYFPVRTFFEPSFKSDTSWVYDFQGIEFEVEPNSSITYENGPDFMIYNFILKGNDTLGLYLGMHPSLPFRLSEVLNKDEYNDYIRNYFLEKATHSDNHYVEIDSVLLNQDDITVEEITNDSIFLNQAVFGKVEYEVVISETTIIWICKPYERSGQIDVLVEYKGESSSPKYHFFGQIESWNEGEKLIDLAKQLK